MFDKIISLLFPKVCGICKQKINKNSSCKKCSNILKYTMERELCVKKIGTYVDIVVSLFIYRDFIRNAIIELKFYGKKYIAEMFADMICQTIINRKIKADVLIPVPIHKTRLKERGFNQSQLISKIISDKIGIKHDSKVLKKTKNNVAQSTLPARDRAKNVVGVYDISSNKNVIGKSILLIDDIYTTGATVNECAKVLKRYGAKEVIVMTIAYAKMNND